MVELIFVGIGIAGTLLLQFLIREFKKRKAAKKKLEYPKIIYKYRNWTDKYHKKMLLQNEVYMSSPKDFNDPFDCRIPKNFYSLNTDEKIESFVDKMIGKHRQTLIENGKDIDKLEENLRGRLQDLEAFQNESENLEFSEMDKHYGVLSLSARWDSILMWSHYGDYHKGYCIGFNEKKMRESNLFGSGGNVNYRTDFPDINPLISEDTMVKAFKQTHNKVEDWKYEEEYRLTKLFFPDLPKQEDRTIGVPEELIEEVNLGMKIADEHKAEIVAQCKKRNIPVYQLEKVPLKFELTRIQL